MDLKDQSASGVITQIKEYFAQMTRRRKITIMAVAGIVISFAVAVALFLNISSGKYTQLYSNLDPTEAGDIYRVLLTMGADAQIRDNQVFVQTAEYDVWLLQLAGQGFPRSALTYDVFSSHSGMTTTESEKRQWLVYQLQDRIQSTLQRINGVTSSTITITMPESSEYIWEQATGEEKATAGVLLTLEKDVKLSGEQVTSIKNLIASSVPQMSAEDVTVLDGATSLELAGTGGGNENSMTYSQNIELEQIVQKRIEDNIVRVLEPRYGSSGVVAAAKVTLNYDKMITESMQLQEKPPDANGEGGGGGYPTHTDGEFTVGEGNTIGGIVGEQDNTDVPQYGYVTGGQADDATYYRWNTDVDYSYIKTQVEKGNAVIERVTVSVMVDEKNMTETMRADLTGIVSNSVDVPVELVFVSAFDPYAEQPVEPEPDTDEPGGVLIGGIPLWALIVAGVVLIIIIATVILIIFLKRRSNKHREQEEFLREEEAKRQTALEIDSYKKQLSNAAKTTLSEKDDAIVTEVRDFAKHNPEITANLLRSWLKEGE